MRFDLIVNQFVLEALSRRRLVIYEGDYRRSLDHVRDVVRALILFATTPISGLRGKIFNVGNDDGSHSKTDIVEMICAEVSGVQVERRDLSFGGDMRDVAVSCARIAQRLGFRAAVPVREGIVEIRDGLIHQPDSSRYRNHAFSVQ